jgi:hypothetical protein
VHPLDAEAGRAPSISKKKSGGLDFTWISRLPCGTSRSLLLGVKTDTMDLLASSDGYFHIKLLIHNKAYIFT